MDTKIRGLFETRRQAEMAVERLVQEFKISAKDISIAALGDENSAGKTVSGADKSDGPVDAKPRDDAALQGSIAVSVNARSDVIAKQVNQAFGEFQAGSAAPANAGEAVQAAEEHGHMSEQWVRERAYALWEAAGCPDGRDEEFWREAETEAGQS